MLHTLFCVSFWAIIFSFIFYKIVSAFSQGIDHLQRLHQIPCSQCAYFTGDYRLKCPVNPLNALSEQAIGCRDFQANGGCQFNNFQSLKNIHYRKSSN